MKSIVIGIVLLAIGSNVTLAQTGISNALQQIEVNNPTLQALQAQSEGIKADARVELLPPNPSIEGGRFPAVKGAGVKYAWGVSQHFEFPTVYAKRAQLARTTDRLAESIYNLSRQSILLDAKLTIIELVHCRMLLSEYSRREAFAKSMQQLIEKMVRAGHASSMDLNNARLRVAEATQNVRECEVRVDILNQKLRTLNNSQELQITDTTLMAQKLPVREDLLTRFLSSDPHFLALNLMVEASEDNKVLVTHEGLPNLTIGYQSEQNDVEHFMGFMAGISIPLWGNQNRRRAATVQLNAARLEKHSQTVMLENEFYGLYLRAASSGARLKELSQALEGFSNISMLKRALELGQISIIDFFNEVTFLYGVTDKVLDLELEYAQAFAELHKFEL